MANSSEVRTPAYSCDVLGGKAATLNLVFEFIQSEGPQIFAVLEDEEGFIHASAGRFVGHDTSVACGLKDFLGIGSLLKEAGAISEKVCSALQKVLKDAREEAGLSLNELSKRAGLNRMAITFIEKGERIPTMQTFVRIAAALGLPPSELLVRSEKAAATSDWQQVGKSLEKARKKKE